MDDGMKAPHRFVWLSGPKAGQVEPPWPEAPELTPAQVRLIESVAQKAVDDYLAGKNKAEAAVPQGRAVIRLPEVMRRVGLKKSAIYKRMGDGTFPKPLSDGGVNRWFESDIDEYIARLKARRNRGATD